LRGVTAVRFSGVLGNLFDPLAKYSFRRFLIDANIHLYVPGIRYRDGYRGRFKGDEVQPPFWFARKDSL
jgi:hypothetical protein